MTMIGTLAYKTSFDGRALQQGLLNTRQQMSEGKKITESLTSATEKFQNQLKNIEELSKRYPKISENRLLVEKQLERQFLSSEKAVRRLTDQEERRLKMLRSDKGLQAASKAGIGLAQPAQPKSSGIGEAGALAGAAGLAGVPLGTLAVAGSALMIAGKGLANSMQLETTTKQLEVMTGSTQQAALMIGKLRDLARKGVSLSGLTESAKTMLSFGTETEKVVPILTAISNIAGGDVERIRGLSLAFAQTSSMGRLMGQELLQLVNAGFNPLAEISRTTGRSMAQLKKDMENGLISSQMVADAFISATSAGGRFNGMLGEMQKTTAGALTSLQSLAEMRLTALGDSLSPIAVQFAGLIKDVDTLAGKLTSLPNALASKFDFSFFDGLAGAVAMARDGLSTLTGSPTDGALNGLLDAREKRARDKELAKAQKDHQAKLDAIDKQIADKESALKTSRTLNNKPGIESATRDITRLKNDRQNLVDQADPRGAMTARLEREAAKKQSIIDAERKKESERKAAVEQFTKPLQDKMQVDQWNKQNPNVQANSVQEVEVLKRANKQELERIAFMRTQVELSEKLRDNQAEIARIMQGTNAIPTVAGKTAFMQTAIDQADGKPTRPRREPAVLANIDQPRMPTSPMAEQILQQPEQRLQQMIQPAQPLQRIKPDPLQPQPQPRMMPMMQPQPILNAFGAPAYAPEPAARPTLAEQDQAKQTERQSFAESGDIGKRTADEFSAMIQRIQQSLAMGQISQQQAMQQQWAVQGQMQQQLAGSPNVSALAPSMQVGSQEAYKYLAELSSPARDVKADPKDNEVKKLQEQQLKSIEKQTRLLEKILDKTPVISRIR